MLIRKRAIVVHFVVTVFFINSKKENTKKKVAPEKKKRAKGKKVFPKRKYDAVRAYVWHKEGSVRLGFQVLDDSHVASSHSDWTRTPRRPWGEHRGCDYFSTERH